MTDNEKEQYYFRGIFMSLFIDIEFMLVNILCSLLVKDSGDKMNLQEFITPDILLRKKVNTIKAILKQKHPELHNKYKSDLEDLGGFTDLRNNFAHRRIEIDSVKKVLYFMTVVDGKSHKDSLTYDILNTKFEKLKTILTNINEIENELAE